MKHPHLPRTTFSATIFSMLLLAVGCSTVTTSTDCELSKCKSTIVSDPLATSDISNGVVYNLPKQLLEFKIERKEVTKKLLQEKVSKSKEVLKKASKAVADQDKVIKGLDFKVSKAAAGTASAGKLALEAELARVHSLLLKHEKLKADKAVTQAEKDLAAFKGETYRDAISLKPLDPIPDSAKRFSAQVNKSAFTSEMIELKTTDSGLLSGGTGKSEGNLDEIFVALVKSFATIQTVSAPESAFHLQLYPSVVVPCNAPAGTKLTIRFDPAIPSTLDTLNTQLKKKKLCYFLNAPKGLAEAATIDYKTGEHKDSGAGAGEGTDKDNYYDGLVYPVKSAIQLDLYQEKTPIIALTNLEPYRSFFPVVIDQSNLGVISLPKGYFADNNYEFEFANGLLTRYKSVTPNQLLSALGMIPEAGKAILSIPAEIIQLKVDYSSKETAYVEAQQALYEARLSYEERLKAEADSDVGDVD